MTRKTDKALRITALFMTLLLFGSLMTGCGYRSIAVNDEDLRAVGTIGNYTVHYEELYYYTMACKEVLKNRYGADIFDTAESSALYADELRELVYSNITANYAILTMASGIQYGLSDIEHEIDPYLEDLVEEIGGMHAYRKMLHENRMTDHLLRFQYGVNVLQSNVFYSYVNYLGLIEADAKEICSIILDTDTYIATLHIAVFKDNGKTDEENLAYLRNIQAMLDGGEAFETLAETYGEDTELDLHYGYYFMKGEMQEAYETAAFSLSVGETSDIVETEGGFFLIKRIEKQEEYVLLNCYGSGAALYDGYQKYTFVSMVDEVQKTLVFVPNTYCVMLDLAAFEEELFFDLEYFLMICGICLLGCGVVALIVWWCAVSIRQDSKSAKKRKYTESRKRRRR